MSIRTGISSCLRSSLEKNLRFLIYHGAEDDHFDTAETMAESYKLFLILGIS